mgnify:CR=1 FL=1
MADTRAAVSISIGAKLGNTFKNSFTAADKQLSKLGATIKNVEGKAAQIEAYKQQSRALNQVGQAYKEARERLNRLKREMNAAGVPTKSLSQDIKKAERNFDKVKTTFQTVGRQTREMGSALRQAGINTHTLTKEMDALSKSLNILKNRQAQVQRINNAKAANLARRSAMRSQIFDTVALGTALYGTIKPAVDFEYAMAKVGAITNEAANGQGFKLLTEQARELGRTTQYTSAQAAEAMQFLGMAGFNTQQILKATPAALNLAIAGNMDLGRTADIASNILTGFGIKAEETARVADVLAQASRSTNVNVEMLGGTMKYAAPVAAAVGGTLEETAALAGVLGDAGIQATMSGTMLRAAYLRLAAPVGKGAKALDKMKNSLHLTAEEMPEVAKRAAYTQAHLKQMGVSIFDKNGRMRSMVDILKDMSIALKDADDQKKLETVKAIFGDRAAPGALNIFKSIQNMRFDEVMDKINNSHGAAQEMADRMKATTRGAFLEMKSAIESVSISFGSVLLPTITKAMRTFAGWANSLSKWVEEHPNLSKAIGYTVIGLISLKISAIAVGYAFTFMASPILSILGFIANFRAARAIAAINTYKNGIVALGTGFKYMGAIAKRSIPFVLGGLKQLLIFMLTNPIGIAITAIAVGAFLIIKYWKPIKGFFIKLWKGISDGSQKVWEKIKKITEPIAKLKQAVGNAWNELFGNGDKKDISAITHQPEVGQSVAADVGKNIDPLNSKVKTAIAHDNSSQTNVHNNITINAAKGMDEAALAREIKRALDDRERQIANRRRALNYG